MMWYWGGGMPWWGWLLGGVGMVIFWGLVVWGIWYSVMSVTRQSDHCRQPRDAKAILDERLARGEIDAAEYRRLREVIRGDGVRAREGQTRVGAGDRR